MNLPFPSRLSARFDLVLMLLQTLRLARSLSRALPTIRKHYVLVQRTASLGEASFSRTRPITLSLPTLRRLRQSIRGRRPYGAVPKS